MEMSLLFPEYGVSTSVGIRVVSMIVDAFRVGSLEHNGNGAASF